MKCLQIAFAMIMNLSLGAAEKKPNILLLFADDLGRYASCLSYTSDAADDLPCVDLGGRRIIKIKNFPQREVYSVPFALATDITTYIAH